jgi:hypothetical protein
MANTTGKKHGGRKKGTPNKVTQAQRELFSTLLSNNLTSIQAALEEVRQDDPAKFIELVLKLAQYSLPTLKAIEYKGSADAGFFISFKDPDSL